MGTDTGKSLTIGIGKIKVSEMRGRKDFGDIEGLVESIKKFGLIHPIVVSNLPDGRYELIAGARRLRASMMLGHTEIRAMFREDLSEIERKEIELEEDLKRKDRVWQEEIETLRQIDELKRQLHGEKLPGQSGEEGWTLEKTAELVGKSTGRVSVEVNFAKLIKDRPDIADRVKALPLKAAIKKAKRLLEVEDVERQLKAGVFTSDTSIREGDARELVRSLQPESVDLLVTDPPYGNVTLAEAQKKEKDGHLSYMAGAAPTDNLTPDEVNKLMKDLIPELYRVLKPSSHFYIFHTSDFYARLVKMMRAAGFLVDSVPLIWDKQATTGPFLGYSYSSCYEQILFGHKPPRSKRLAKPERAILQVKGPGKNKLHPFQKPSELIRLFLKQSSDKGNLVLDPFAGAGEVVVVAKQLLRRGIGFEINHEHFLVCQDRLQSEEDPGPRGPKGYVDLLPGDSGDFTKLRPGTKEWIVHWRSHPEDQEKMTAFARTLIMGESE